MYSRVHVISIPTMKWFIFVVTLLVITMTYAAMGATDADDINDENTDQNGDVKYTSRRRDGKRANDERKQKKHRLNGLHQNPQDVEPATEKLDEVANNLPVSETPRRHRKNGSHKHGRHGAANKTENYSRQKSTGRKSTNDDQNKGKAVYRHHVGKGGSKNIRTNQTSSASQDFGVKETTTETGYVQIKKNREGAKNDADATVHKRTGRRNHKRRPVLQLQQGPMDQDKTQD